MGSVFLFVCFEENVKSQKLQIEIVTQGLLRSKQGPTGTWTAQELVPDFITATIHHKHITNDQDSDFWLYLHKNYAYWERNKVSSSFSQQRDCCSCVRRASPRAKL